jgi:hypothetical protein
MEQSSRNLPATPEKPVAGYYRCPSPEPRWMYYDGRSWVGEPVALPWYRRPMAGVRGRPPWGALIVFLVLVGAGVGIWALLR